MHRPANAYWFRLKDKARIRGGGRCEYCGLRYVHALHHRTYEREGRERLADVMAVCDRCHRTIHGLIGGELLVAIDSLASRGDCGFNNCYHPGHRALWVRYLRSRRK
jgi:HNH endonuclease